MDTNPGKELHVQYDIGSNITLLVLVLVVVVCRVDGQRKGRKDSVHGSSGLCE